MRDDDTPASSSHDDPVPADSADVSDADVDGADVDVADDRQLHVWAYGRSHSAADQGRADAALIELARRAALSSLDQDLDQDLGVDQDRVRDQDPARTRRRTRIMRTASLIVAALVVGATALALSAPGTDPDPLAIFDRAETESDEGWAELLTQDYVTTITLGPRTVELGDDRVAIAFRSAAVADGRSTEYDPYCLVTSDTSGGGLSGQCVTPERFASEGIVLPIAPSASGNGFDTAIWGPTGFPRLETDRALEPLTAASNILDSMAFSSVVEVDVDPIAIVSKPDWLLMGPVQVPTYFESRSESSSELNPELLSDRSNDASAAPPSIVTSTYLLRGESTATSAVFCAHAAVSDSEATTMCAPLSAVRRQGLEFTVIVQDRAWVVSIGADGAEPLFRVRAGQ